MEVADYRHVKRQLNFTRHPGVAFAVITLDLALIAVATHLFRSGNVVAYLGSQLLLAIVLFHNFGLLHEAGHGNCARSQTINTVIGLYTSVLCFTPFFPWQHLHQLHHTWVGNATRDPSGKNLKTWRDTGQIPSPIRFAWRSYLPLGALAQHILFLSYPLILLRADRSRLCASIVSVLLLPCAYAGLHWLAPDVVSLRGLGLAVVLYMIGEELVNLPHHADLLRFDRRLPLREQWRASRSCYYPRVMSELLMLNFNFHVEHHLFPALPWYRLRQARALIKPVLGTRYREAAGCGWIVRARKHDMHDVVLHTQPATRTSWAPPLAASTGAESES